MNVEEKNKKQISMIFPALFSFLFLMAVLYICVINEFEQTALITLLAIIVALIPFFVVFEKRRSRPRDILPIVIMAAIGTAGRVLFAAFPSFKPVLAIVIVTAMAFGPESAFMTGALMALASNIFFGQGPWTPWQMYGFGIVGYIAGLLSQKGLFKRPIAVYIFGFLSALFYGLILDSWHIVSFLRPFTWQGALILYGQGLIFNITLAVATVVFLIPIRVPWTRQLKRIKRKFGLLKT